MGGWIGKAQRNVAANLESNHMLPKFILFDLADGLGVNAIFLSDYKCGSAISTNGQDLRFTEDRHAMFFAVCVSSLLFGIIMVCFVSSKKQMVRVYAGGIVAMVQDQQFIGNLAFQQLMGEPVRKNHSVSRQTDSPISAFLTVSLPFPAASFVFLYVLQQSFENIFFTRIKSSLVVNTTETFFRRASESIVAALEGILAVVAGKCYGRHIKFLWEYC